MRLICHVLTSDNIYPVMSHCHQQLVLNLLELQKERITRMITNAKAHFCKNMAKRTKAEIYSISQGRVPLPCLSIGSMR